MEGLGVDGKILLKNQSYRSSMDECGLDSSNSGWREVPHSCEHGNESSESTQHRKFLCQAEELLASLDGFSPVQLISSLVSLFVCY